ncbi:hypothetical protein FRC02_002335 [Tulasnella sp. 418]|nr:hypothetical protein FRC02_002335 [Tulasnella sp. 418]
MTPRALQSIFHCTNIVNLSLTELTRQCRWSLPPAYTMESVRKLELGFGSDDDSLSDESDVELDDGTIIPSEVSFPFLRELWIEDPRVWILAWLRKIAAESRHVTQLVFQAHASLHQRVLSCLNEFKNLKGLIISQRSKGLRAIRGHKLHEWLSKLPHIELFRWTLPGLDEVPVLQYVDRRRYLSFGDLAQLLKICSRIRILSVPLQAYEPSDQLLLGKASNNASTISTELSSLTLDIFNLKNAEFKQCPRKLVHLLPSGVNLNIKLRPIGEGDSYLCEVSREVINLREAKLDYMIQQERKRKESEDKSMEL